MSPAFVWNEDPVEASKGQSADFINLTEQVLCLTLSLLGDNYLYMYKQKKKKERKQMGQKIKTRRERNKKNRYHGEERDSEP